MSRNPALLGRRSVLAAVLGFIFLGEVPSTTEIAAFVAISAGVSIGASRGYAGSPASSSAPMKRPA